MNFIQEAAKNKKKAEQEAVFNTSGLQSHISAIQRPWFKGLFVNSVVCVLCVYGIHSMSLGSPSPAIYSIIKTMVILLALLSIVALPCALFSNAVSPTTTLRAVSSHVTNALTLSFLAYHGAGLFIMCVTLAMWIGTELVMANSKRNFYLRLESICVYCKHLFETKEFEEWTSRDRQLEATIKRIPMETRIGDPTLTYIHGLYTERRDNPELPTNTSDDI